MDNISSRFQKRVAEIIKHARGNKYKSARLAAETLGIPPTTYTGYENGTRSPDYITLCRLCRAFDITPNQVFGFYNNDINTENDDIKILTEACLAEDEEFVSQQEIKNGTIVHVKSQRLGSYLLHIDNDFYKSLERMRIRSFKEIIGSQLRQIRVAKSVEMKDSIEICKTFNFHINITQDNYYQHEKEVNRFVLFHIFNYFLSPVISEIEDDVRKKYNTKFFDNEFYNDETCEQFGKIIPNIFRSLAIEKYFLRYYVFALRNENMKLSDLGNEIEYFKSKYMNNEEPDINIYYRLQKEFFKLNTDVFQEKL